MDGTPLPDVIVQVLADKIEIIAGHIQLNLDGTCTVSATSRDTINGVVTMDTDVAVCIWTLNNTAISLSYATGDRDAGSLIDETISITAGGFVLVYRK